MNILLTYSSYRTDILWFQLTFKAHIIRDFLEQFHDVQNFQLTRGCQTKILRFIHFIMMYYHNLTNQCTITTSCPLPTPTSMIFVVEIKPEIFIFMCSSTKQRSKWSQGMQCIDGCYSPSVLCEHAGLAADAATGFPAAAPPRAPAPAFAPPWNIKHMAK